MDMYSLLGSKCHVGIVFSPSPFSISYNYSIRDNAESIAFYAGEDIENKEVVNRLEKVIDNRKQINTSQRNVDFFTTSYNCEFSLRCPNFRYPSDYMISTILASHVFSHSHMLFSSPQSS
jgi:ABC-type uncharacterized transport system fused permease/ATPase subunit